MRPRSYTLHLPAEAEPGDPEPLERAELVRDGFRFGAFVFTALWFFWHRLWLAGLIVLAVLVSVGGGLAMLRLGVGTVVLVAVLLALLIGLEAGALASWTYARRGRPPVAVVRAADQDEAAARAFSWWLAERDGIAPAEPAGGTGYGRSEPVLGLFPEPEPRR